MPVSVASKLGIHVARFVAASGNAANTAQYGFRNAFNNAGLFGNSAGGSTSSATGASSSPWASSLSTGGASSSSSASGTGLGGAKFHAGRGAHSSFQQSGRALANANGSSAHDGTTTSGDDDDDTSLQAARIHRSGTLHRSTVLAPRHWSTSSSLAARQRFTELQLILPTQLSRSMSSYAAQQKEVSPLPEEPRHDAEEQLPLGTTESDSTRISAQSLRSGHDDRLSGGTRRSLQRKGRSLSTSAIGRAEAVADVDTFAAALDRTQTSVQIGTRRQGNQDSRWSDNELLRLRGSRDLVAVEAAIERMLQLPKEELSTQIFNEAIAALRACNVPATDVHKITDLYVRMINSSCLPNLRTLSLLARSLCMAEIRSFYTKPREEATRPKDDYFLQALSILNIVHTSLHGFDRIDPYNEILQCCRYHGDAARACDVLNLLSTCRNVSANAETFRLVLSSISGYGVDNKPLSDSSESTHRLAACKEIFNEFESLRASDGWQRSADDIKVWNDMIAAHFKLNDADGALALLERLLDSTKYAEDLCEPPKPVESTAQVLLNGFFNQEDWESLSIWLDRLTGGDERSKPHGMMHFLEPTKSYLFQLASRLTNLLPRANLQDLTEQEVIASLPIMQIALSAFSHALWNTRGRLKARLGVIAMHEMLQFNASAAATLLKGGATEEAGTLLDTSLALVDTTMRATGSLLGDWQPLEGNLHTAVELVNALSSTSDQLLAMSRAQDAAMIMTYVAGISHTHTPASSKARNKQYPSSASDEAVATAKRNAITRLSERLMHEHDQSKLVDVIVALLEQAARTLRSIDQEPIAVGSQFANFYRKVRADVGNVAELPLSTEGWKNALWLASVAELGDLREPFWPILLEDVALLPDEMKADLAPEAGILLPIVARKHGSPAQDAVEAIWPAFDVRKFSSAVSESIDSLLQDAPSPASTVATSTSLPPVQVVDTDFGEALMRSLAKDPRNGRTLKTSDMQTSMQTSLAQVRESIQTSGNYPGPDAVGKLMILSGRFGELGVVRELYDIGSHIIAYLQGAPSWQANAWREHEDSMIQALAHGGDAKAASEHRQKLISSGSAPSADSYASLIAVIRDTTDDVRVAEQLYEEAIRLNVTPTVYFMNTIISKFCRARKMEKALQLFNRMVEIGLTPSSVTFGALINGAVRTGDAAKAEELFALMKRNSPFPPKAPPFNSMMQFYVYTQPDRSKVASFYHDMRSMNMKPTAYTYKLLLDMQRIEPLDLAGLDRVFGELIADPKVDVEGQHWASLITIHGIYAKNLEKAISLFEAIPEHVSTKSKSGGLQAVEAVAWEALFDVFLAHERRDLMSDYWQRLRASSVQPTAYVANVLLRSLGGHDMPQARALFSEMYDPPSGVAATGNHPDNHRHHADAEQGPSAQEPLYPTSAPVSAQPSAFGLANVAREPSTFEIMIKLELRHGSQEAARWLLDRMQQRGYPAALVKRIQSNLRDLFNDSNDSASMADSSVQHVG